MTETDLRAKAIQMMTVGLFLWSKLRYEGLERIDWLPIWWS